MNLPNSWEMAIDIYIHTMIHYKEMCETAKTNKYC